jgi:hypothetical protein
VSPARSIISTNSVAIIHGMRTLLEPIGLPVDPAPRASAPSRPRRARLGSVGAIAALLVLPPAVLGLLFFGEPEADRGARDSFEQGLMAASVLLVLVAHAWTLVELLRGRRERARQGAGER